MLRLLGEAAGNCGLAGRLFGVLEKSTAMNNQLRTGADKGSPTVELKQSIAMARDGVDAM